MSVTHAHARPTLDVILNDWQESTGLTIVPFHIIIVCTHTPTNTCVTCNGRLTIQSITFVCTTEKKTKNKLKLKTIERDFGWETMPIDLWLLWLFMGISLAIWKFLIHFRQFLYVNCVQNYHIWVIFVIGETSSIWWKHITFSYHFGKLNNNNNNNNKNNNNLGNKT